MNLCMSQLINNGIETLWNLRPVVAWFIINKTRYVVGLNASDRSETSYEGTTPKQCI